MHITDTPKIESHIFKLYGFVLNLWYVQVFSCSIAFSFFFFLSIHFIFYVVFCHALLQNLQTNNFQYEYWRRRNNEKNTKNTVTYHLKVYKSSWSSEEKRNKMINYNETHTHTHRRGAKKIYRKVVVVVALLLFSSSIAFRWKYCASIKHVCLLIHKNSFG